MSQLENFKPTNASQTFASISSSSVAVRLNNAIRQTQKAALTASAKQEATSEDIQESLAADGNPMNSKALPKKKTIKERKDIKRARKAEEALKGKGAKSLESLENALKNFKEDTDGNPKKNEELDEKSLILLSDNISEMSGKEEIMAAIGKFYKDPFLQDDALEFLISANPKLAETLIEIKNELNDKFGARINSSRDIAEEARAFASDKMGSPVALRELYFNMTHNPQEATTIFHEFSSQHEYADLVKICKFLFNSIGRDLNAQGATIPRGLLHRLMSESKNLQAVKGVFETFKDSEALMFKQFEKNGIGY